MAMKGMAMQRTERRLGVVTVLRPDVADRWAALSGDPHLEVTAGGTGVETELLVAVLRPDVMLVDARLNLPPALTTGVLHRSGATVVVAVPSVDAAGSARHISAGAAGCVETFRSADFVATALQAAAAGKLVLPRHLVAAVIVALTGPAHAASVA
jgi:DNA-binding NarL/FixJ family response regulator